MSFIEGEYFLKNKAITACALSHIKIWKDFLNDNTKEYAVIFEDDFIFCNNFANKWKTLIQSLNSDNSNELKQTLDLIYLGYRLAPNINVDSELSLPYNEEDFKFLKLSPMKDNSFYWAGAECYLITKNGAKFLLNIVESQGLRYPIDTVMLYAFRHCYGNFNAFCCVPRLGTSPLADTNNEVDSDIQREKDQIPYNLNIKVSDTITNERIRSLPKAINRGLSQDCDTDNKYSVYIADSTDNLVDIDFDPVLVLNDDVLISKGSLNSVSVREDSTTDKDLKEFIEMCYFNVWK